VTVADARGAINEVFRIESPRLIAGLARMVRDVGLAEDLAQDALVTALEHWPASGVPDNPGAWLMATAKNRAIDVLRRERTARTFAPELGRLLETEWTLAPVVEELFGAQALHDDVLRMMLTACHPGLTEEARVALVLHIVCGFSVGEIAAAFLSTHPAIEKRIVRAKKVLARSQKLFDLADRDRAHHAARLSAVQRALYLLFNEGYHGASPESAVRTELCREAMRLSALLLDHPVTSTPGSQALAALMCLHAARLPARVDSSGNLSSLYEQDRSLWDRALVLEGLKLLDLSARGEELTEYHLEAAIASIHATAARPEDTRWGEIVRLYDQLMALRPSPIVALNRAIAVAEHEGPTRGLEEIEAIAGRERLASYPFYTAALGELELRRGRREVAQCHFRAALDAARSPIERRFLERRMRACGA
jgi:RNA polymerase sigma factor (sigma-70 family)